jgi:hypothetical protein
MTFEVKKHIPSAAQRAYLQRGLAEPGGKLPLFDAAGQQIDPRTIKACIEQGWAEPWFSNPLKPDWLVCKLTPAGRTALAEPTAAKVNPSRRPVKATVEY